MASLPNDVKERNEIKKHFYNTFHQKVDKEIIDMVLAGVNYKKDETYEQLIAMAGDSLEPSTQKTMETNVRSVKNKIQTNSCNKKPNNLLEQFASSPTDISELMITSSSIATDDPSVISAGPTIGSAHIFSNSSLNRPGTDSLLSPRKLGKPPGLFPSEYVDVPTDKYGTPVLLPNSSSLHDNFFNMVSTSPVAENMTIKPDVVRSNKEENLNNCENALKNYINDQSKLVLVIMRGLPGCGKSYRARKLNRDTVHNIFSADDYFIKNGWYIFDQFALSDAHQWNQARAKKAMDEKISPIFIDNTNMQSWEMKPYIFMAYKRKYEIKIIEPNTNWAWNPSLLAKKNTHHVSKEKIVQLMDRYEKNVTVESMKRPDDLVGNPHEKDHMRKATRSPRSRSPANGEPSKNTEYGKIDYNSLLQNEPKPLQDIAYCAGNESPVVKPKNTSDGFNNIADMISYDSNFNTSDGIVSATSSPVVHNVADKSLISGKGVERETNFVVGPCVARIKDATNVTESDTFNKTMQYTESPMLHKELPADIEVSLIAEKMQNNKNEKQILGRPNSNPGRIGSLVNSYKSWSSENEKLTTEVKAFENKVEHIDLEEMDILDLTDKSQELRVRNESIPDEQLQYSLEFLFECFPDSTKTYCKKWLKRYNGDLIKTCDYLSRLSQLDVPDEDEVIVINDENECINLLSPDKKIDGEELLDGKTDGEDLLEDKGTRKCVEPAGEMFYCDKDNQDHIRIAIDKRLGMELMKEFGEGSTINTDDLGYDDYIFDLEKDFVKQLYNSWMLSIKVKKRKVQTMLDDDAKLAKMWQEKENSALDSPDGKGKKKKTKPSAIDIQYNKDQPAQLFSSQSPWNTPNQINKFSPTVVTIKDGSGCVLTPKQLQIRQNLYQQFPGVEEEALDQVLEVSSYNIEAASAIVRSSCGINNKNVQNVFAEGNPNQWKVVSSPPRKKLDQTKSPVNTVTNRNVAGPSQVSGAAGNSSTANARIADDNSVYQTFSEDKQDYQDFRAEADLHANLRAEYFQKAAKAFQEKRGELAQFYADKAHQHTIKMKEAHHRAAELTLLRKNKPYLKKKHTIDLHGLHADEAVRALTNFIDNAHDVGHEKVFIITGRGNHSKGGYSRVRKAIVRVLEQQKHRFKFENNNHGKLVVYL